VWSKPERVLIHDDDDATHDEENKKGSNVCCFPFPQLRLFVAAAAEA
jgi:hypothetical protein